MVRIYITICFYFFFFNDTATTEIYTLSLHDALPISHHVYAATRGRAVMECRRSEVMFSRTPRLHYSINPSFPASLAARSEEHTSELQSQSNLVCRLLLEKKNTITILTTP